MIEQNWKQLSSIQIGGVICLPVIVIGQALGQAYGFPSAVLAILIGNGILLVLAAIAAVMSHDQKKTTIENTSTYFGKKGAVFFASVMLISMLGWFGIQLNLMCIALLDLLSIPSQGMPFMMGNLGLGLMMTLVALYGIRGLNLLSDISLPLLIATLAYALFMPSEKVIKHEATLLELGGISMVIATAIAVVIDLPTYFRHARSKKDALIGVSLIFGLAIPIIELIGVYLGSVRGGESVIDLLKGTNFIWNIWIALFIILAGWTTNNTNIYSCVISLEFMWPHSTFRVRTWTIGLLGSLLACCNLLDHLELILELLGISIGSMGAVVLLSYMLNTTVEKYWTLSAWIFGASLGFCSLNGFLPITSISILDAFMGACLGTLLIYIKQRTRNVVIRN